MAAQITEQDVRDRRHANYDAVLIMQLQCVHLELRAKLASAAQISTDESYKNALLHLSRNIDTLAQKFLRLAGKLLDGGQAASEPEHSAEILC